MSPPRGAKAAARPPPSSHAGAAASAHRDSDLHRLIQLSDGMFAIALTLLAFDLKPPEGWDGRAASLVFAMQPSLLAFGLSFLIIAFYWVAHRRCFRRIRHADGVLTALNFLSLGMITLLPAMTRLLMQNGPGTDGQPLYLGLIAAIGLSNALMWGYAALRPGVMELELPMPQRIVQFLTMLIVPPALAVFTLLSARPGGRWALVGIVALAVVTRTVRRWAGKGAKL